MKYRIEDTGECIVIHVLDNRCLPAITIMLDMTFDELIDQINDIYISQMRAKIQKKEVIT